MHHPTGAPNTLLDILRKPTRLRVHDACENERVACTHLYVAKADEVMTVDGNGSTRADSADSKKRTATSYLCPGALSEI